MMASLVSKFRIFVCTNNISFFNFQESLGPIQGDNLHDENSANEKTILDQSDGNNTLTDSEDEGSDKDDDDENDYLSEEGEIDANWDDNEINEQVVSFVF